MLYTWLYVLHVGKVYLFYSTLRPQSWHSTWHTGGTLYHLYHLAMEMEKEETWSVDPESLELQS